MSQADVDARNAGENPVSPAGGFAVPDCRWYDDKLQCVLREVITLKVFLTSKQLKVDQLRHLIERTKNLIAVKDHVLKETKKQLGEVSLETIKEENVPQVPTMEVEMEVEQMQPGHSRALCQEPVIIDKVPVLSDDTNLRPMESQQEENFNLAVLNINNEEMSDNEPLDLSLHHGPQVPGNGALLEKQKDKAVEPSGNRDTVAVTINGNGIGQMQVSVDIDISKRRRRRTKKIPPTVGAIDDSRKKTDLHEHTATEQLGKPGGGGEATFPQELTARQLLGPGGPRMIRLKPLPAYFFLPELITENDGTQNDPEASQKRDTAGGSKKKSQKQRKRRPREHSETLSDLRAANYKSIDGKSQNQDGGKPRRKHSRTKKHDHEKAATPECPERLILEVPRERPRRQAAIEGAKKIKQISRYERSVR